MSDTPTATIVKRDPMSAADIVDLRRRVLAREPVSDDELRHALESLALARATAPPPRSTTATSVPAIANLKNDFVEFMAKTKKTDTSGTPQLDAPKRDNGQ